MSSTPSADWDQCAAILANDSLELNAPRLVIARPPGQEPHELPSPICTANIFTDRKLRKDDADAGPSSCYHGLYIPSPVGYKTELRIVLDISMETAVGLFTTINPQVHLTPV